MSKLKCVALAGALLFATSAANAQMKVYAESGGWKALAGLNKEGSPMCTMSLASDIRHIMIKWQASDQGFYFHLVKNTWNIPADVTMPIAVQFDQGVPFEGKAYGKEKAPKMVESTIASADNGDTFAKFMEEFMDASKMIISFPGGSEGDWVARLDGSEKIGRAFKRCVSDVRAKFNPTQPHRGGGAPTQPHRGGTPTQPHQGGSTKSPAPVKPSPNDREA